MRPMHASTAMQAQVARPWSSGDAGTDCTRSSQIGGHPQKRGGHPQKRDSHSLASKCIPANLSTTKFAGGQPQAGQTAHYQHWPLRIAGQASQASVASSSMQTHLLQPSTQARLQTRDCVHVVVAVQN